MDSLILAAFACTTVGGALVAGPWWWLRGYHKGYGEGYADAYAAIHAEAMRNTYPEDFKEEASDAPPL